MNFVRIFWVLAVATTLALCIVGQGSATRQAGLRIGRLEREVETLKAEEQKLRAEVSRLQSPQRIIDAARKLGLEQASAPARPEFVPVYAGESESRTEGLAQQ